MKLRIASSDLPKFVLGIGILTFLSGCVGTTQSTLLRSELTATPPLGPVHLPTNKDGVSFQGNISVQGNKSKSVSLGTPNLDNGLLNTSDLDSSRINGPIVLKQEPIVVSGEGSIFMGRNFRLFVGLDGNATHAIWAGAGFSAGSEWVFELDASIGSLINRRDEYWRIKEYASNTTTRDTNITGADSVEFSKFNFTFSQRKGGPVFAYQLMKLPVTTAPNGDEYTKWLHTFTVGYAKPIGIGSLAAFLQATNTGDDWSPSARMQYTFNLGGESSDEN